MEQIYPLREDVIRRYCGYPVCAIMRDGSRLVGILSACRNGEVILGEDPASESKAAATANRKSGQTLKRTKRSASGKRTAQSAGTADSGAKPEKAAAVPVQEPFPNYYAPWRQYPASPRGNGPFGQSASLKLGEIVFLLLAV